MTAAPAGSRQVVRDPGAATASDPVTLASQARRAAWFTLFPTLIGAVSWLFGTPPAAGVRGLAALGAAGLAFFVSLLALASLLRALGGGRFYLRTRTACPGCGRTLFIIQTRCSFCDTSVPVAGPALPTFGMVVAAWAVFECVWFLLS